METSKKNLVERLIDAFVGSKPQVAQAPKPTQEQGAQPNASYHPSSTWIYTQSYNGEKNLGEIGPIKKYSLDYEALRYRSWQAFLESEITQTVIGRYITWMIGPGLKLQAEPSEYMLDLLKVNTKNQRFSEESEAFFALFTNSKRSDFSKMRTLNRLAKTVYKNAIVGGDVLVVLRYDGTDVNIQIIDGAHVKSPQHGTDYRPFVKEDGNTIKHGVEVDKTGKHVGYWVSGKGITAERIDARSKENGLQIAFLVYGLEYRLDNIRGIPLISAVMETLSKLDRYKEATVAAAEEISKIVYTIEHDQFSTGESPITSQLAKAINGLDNNNDMLPETIDGEQLANKVAATTNKMTYNMPIGSKLKQLENKNQIYFKDFYTINIDLVCATMQIPPDVAMSNYGESYSASRAAIKDWEHTLNVGRKDFSEQFYQPIYEYWLDIMILSNRIQAPGYVNARASKNYDVLEVYRTARFVGPSVPFIDPVKEVTAARLRLGDKAAGMPLSTMEQESETLNTGDSDSNLKQFANEYAEYKNLIPEEVPPGAGPTGANP